MELKSLIKIVACTGLRGLVFPPTPCSINISAQRAVLASTELCTPCAADTNGYFSLYLPLHLVRLTDEKTERSKCPGSKARHAGARVNLLWRSSACWMLA